MLKSKIVLVHLTQDSADVKMSVARVRDTQLIIDSFIREVQLLVLNLKSFQQVSETRSKFICFSEETSVVVVCDSKSVGVLLSVHLRLLKELLGQIVCL